MTVTDQIAFVCCVESGSLETQTARMIESLRRWGGMFAHAPVFAVTPRFGSPLSHKTHQAFERLQVEYIRFRAKSKYSWNKFMNKPYALVAVEERSTSESICWLDSDLLILSEPEKLFLNEGEDFIACTPDKIGATTGKEDPNEAYWEEVCKLLEVNIKTLPWIIEERQGIPIRFYFNSGVFVYRRSTGFAKQYLQSCCKLLDAAIKNKDFGFFFVDQIVLGLVVIKMGLKWRSLPLSHNYAMNSKNHYIWYKEEHLESANILHYHNCMQPEFWSEFIKCLHHTHPPVADWLSSLGPLKNDAPLHWRTLGKILKYFRSRQEVAYSKSCQMI